MSDQQESRDPRRGLTWDEMAEIDRRELREGMKKRPGERLEEAIKLSRVATEFAAAGARSRAKQ